MSEDRQCDSLDVFVRDVGFPVRQGDGFAGEHQPYRASRRRSIQDIFVLFPGDACQLRDIMLDLIGNGDSVDLFFDGVQLAMRHDAFYLGHIFFFHDIEDLFLLGEARIFHQYLEEESVDLRFREGIGSFLLYGILRRQDQKRFRQFVRDSSYSDLMLLHRFKQC